MKLTSGEKVWVSVNYLLVALFAFVTVLPVWHVLMQSVSAPSSSFDGVFLWPRGFSMKAYRVVLADPLIGSGFRVTIFTTLCGTLLQLVMAFLGAYPLTHKDLIGRKFLQYMLFFTMLFGGGLIPGYILISKLGMVDTFWALIIPGAVSVYHIFVLRNFIQAIPASLEESARIDGAKDWQVLLIIIIPLSIPIIAVMGLQFGVVRWNDWFSSTIYMNKPSKLSLQAVMRNILMAEGGMATYYNDNQDLLQEAMMPKATQMAVVSVATVPILCVYPFLQKYFVKGVMLGAVKG